MPSDSFLVACLLIVKTKGAELSNEWNFYDLSRLYILYNNIKIHYVFFENT